MKLNKHDLAQQRQKINTLLNYTFFINPNQYDGALASKIAKELLA